MSVPLRVCACVRVYMSCFAAKDYYYVTTALLLLEASVLLLLLLLLLLLSYQKIQRRLEKVGEG